jgi:uncharacterized membrane protein (UPF0127 family)
VRRRKAAPAWQDKKVYSNAGMDAVDAILSRNGAGPLPRSRSLVIAMPDPMLRIRDEVAAKIAKRKLRTDARQIKIRRIARTAAIALAATSIAGATYAAHQSGHLSKGIDLARSGHARVMAMLPQTPATPIEKPAIQPPAPTSTYTARANTCTEDPDQDGCFTGNVVRQGAFLCQDGPRPLALEFASSPIRSAMGLSHRDHIAASTGFTTILPTTTRVNYITKDLRVPIDIIAFHRDGRIAQIVQNVPARRQMPVALQPADGIVALKAGESQRLRITDQCQFAAYEDGVPMPVATSEIPSKASSDKRISQIPQ